MFKTAPTIDSSRRTSTTAEEGHAASIEGGAAGACSTGEPVSRTSPFVAAMRPVGASRLPRVRVRRLGALRGMPRQHGLLGTFLRAGDAFDRRVENAAEGLVHTVRGALDRGVGGVLGPGPAAWKPRTTDVAAGIADDVAAAVIAARCGRIAFGLVLIGGMAALVLSAVDEWESFRPTAILATTWLVAITSAFGVRALARRAAYRWPVRYWPSFTASLAIPSAGLVLALPLGLHMLVIVPIASVRDFDTWVAISLFATAIAHCFTLAVVCYRAPRLGSVEAPSLDAVLAAAIIGSLVPFVIPAPIVGLTAVICLPVFRRLDALALQEREALGGF